MTALLILLLAAGCGGAPAATQNPAPLETPIPTVAQPTATVLAEMPTDETGVKLVAKVNGQGITLPQFEQALARKQQEVDAASPDALRSDVLNQLIEEQ